MVTFALSVLFFVTILGGIVAAGRAGAALAVLASFSLSLLLGVDAVAIVLIFAGLFAVFAVLGLSADPVERWYLRRSLSADDPPEPDARDD